MGNPVIHWELMSKDPAKVPEFYSRRLKNFVFSPACQAMQGGCKFLKMLLDQLPLLPTK